MQTYQTCPQEGDETYGLLKQSLTYLNSKFLFSKTDCPIPKLKSLVCPTIYP